MRKIFSKFQVTQQSEGRTGENGNTRFSHAEDMPRTSAFDSGFLLNLFLLRYIFKKVFIRVSIVKLQAEDIQLHGISTIQFWLAQCLLEGLLGGALVVKNLPANAGNKRDMGPIPGSRISPGGGHGNPLQYSCLENLMDRGAWWATVHGIAKSWT